jgi:hypothetical protein
MHRFFRCLEKHQRHPIACRNPNQFPCCLAFSKLRGLSNDPCEFIDDFALLVTSSFE